VADRTIADQVGLDDVQQVALVFDRVGTHLLAALAGRLEPSLMHTEVEAGPADDSSVLATRLGRAPVATQLVVMFLLASWEIDPVGEVYGLGIATTLGLGSGTVYAIMSRLEEHGLVACTQESGTAEEKRRRLRSYYRLVDPGGVAEARRIVAGIPAASIIAKVFPLVRDSLRSVAATTETAPRPSSQSTHFPAVAGIRAGLPQPRGRHRRWHRAITGQCCL
jgi:hypothetical protein